MYYTCCTAHIAPNDQVQLAGWVGLGKKEKSSRHYVATGGALSTPRMDNQPASPSSSVLGFVAVYLINNVCLFSSVVYIYLKVKFISSITPLIMFLFLCFSIFLVFLFFCLAL